MIEKEINKSSFLLNMENKKDFEINCNVIHRYQMTSVQNFFYFFHPDKERNEREKLFIAFLTNFIYSLCNLTVKFISKYYQWNILLVG